MMRIKDKTQQILSLAGVIIKRILTIAFVAICVISAVVFFAIPLLHSVVPPTIAQWVWYPSTIILLTTVIIAFPKKKDPVFKSPEINFIGEWGFFTIFPIWISIFVLSYYDIDTIWLWIIFGMVAVSVPIFFVYLFAIHFKHNQVDELDRKKLVGNMLKAIFLYWFLDLLYLSIFNSWLIPTFVFGILSLVIIAFNLVDAFLNGASILRFFVALELVLGLVLCGYLIYIIPTDVVQNIVLTISAALIGGIFTLLGVAWTIKKSDANRRDDLWRLEEDRKTEERKKHTPYLRISFDKELPPLVVNANITKVLDLTNNDDRLTLEKNTFYSITIENFTVKNISNSNIILNGVVVYGKYYSFSHTEIVEPGASCQIRTTNNWSVSVSQPQSSILLISTDMLGNKYKTVCLVSYDFNSFAFKTHTLIAGEEFIGFPYTYKITSLELPVLCMDEEDNYD